MWELTSWRNDVATLWRKTSILAGFAAVIVFLTDWLQIDKNMSDLIDQRHSFDMDYEPKKPNLNTLFSWKYDSEKNRPYLNFFMKLWP